MSRTKSLLPTDELNNLITQIPQKRRSELEDDVLELLILSYIKGVESGSMDASREWIPSITDIYDVVFQPIAGKTYEQRIKEYSENGTTEEIKRVIETESHRTYVEGQLRVAKEYGLKKTWVTMLDDKVRDEHAFLEGVTVDANEKFYIGEHSAEAPSMFGVPELDINCRCELFLS